MQSERNANRWAFVTRAVWLCPPPSMAMVMKRVLIALSWSSGMHRFILELLWFKLENFCLIFFVIIYYLRFYLIALLTVSILFEF